MRPHVRITLRGIQMFGVVMLLLAVILLALHDALWASKLEQVATAMLPGPLKPLGAWVALALFGLIALLAPWAVASRLNRHHIAVVRRERETYTNLSGEPPILSRLVIGLGCVQVATIICVAVSAYGTHFQREAMDYWNRVASMRAMARSIAQLVPVHDVNRTWLQLRGGYGRQLPTLTSESKAATALMSFLELDRDKMLEHAAEIDAPGEPISKYAHQVFAADIDKPEDARDIAALCVLIGRVLAAESHDGELSAQVVRAHGFFEYARALETDNAVASNGLAMTTFLEQQSNTTPQWRQFCELYDVLARVDGKAAEPINTRVKNNMLIIEAQFNYQRWVLGNKWGRPDSLLAPQVKFLELCTDEERVDGIARRAEELLNASGAAAEDQVRMTFCQTLCLAAACHCKSAHGDKRERAKATAQGIASLDRALRELDDPRVDAQAVVRNLEDPDMRERFWFGAFRCVPGGAAGADALLARLKSRNGHVG